MGKGKATPLAISQLIDFLRLLECANSPEVNSDGSNKLVISHLPGKGNKDTHTPVNTSHSDLKENYSPCPHAKNKCKLKVHFIFEICMRKMFMEPTRLNFG